MPLFKSPGTKVLRGGIAFQISVRVKNLLLGLSAGLKEWTLWSTPEKVDEEILL